MKKLTNLLKRPMAAIIIACIITAINVTAYAASPTFTDVPAGHWAYEAIEKAVANGLVNGMGDGTYQVDKSVTNAQWFQMVAKLFIGSDLPAPGANDPWWWPAIDRSSSAGFLEGTVLYTTGRVVNRIPFKPEAVDAIINRYDMAQVIYNIANSSYLTVDGVNTTGISERVADYRNIPTKYRAAVEFCYAAGFITGIDAIGTFDGENVMTRGAAATVISRLLDAKNGTWVVPVFENKPVTPEPPVTPTNPTVTAVKDMISVETSDKSSYDYEIKVTNTYTAGKLTNGKEINEVNILAMLNEVKALFPNGMSWGNGSNGDHYRYSSASPAPVGGGCNAFAGMVGDAVFGKGVKWTASTDLTTAKVGDMIHMYNSNTEKSHWAIVGAVKTIETTKLVDGKVVPNGTDLQITWYEGNANGEVHYDVEQMLAQALKAYPNSTLYTAYN